MSLRNRPLVKAKESAKCAVMEKPSLPDTESGIVATLNEGVAALPKVHWDGLAGTKQPF